MAPFVEFTELLENKKYELTDLDENEYLKLGSHIYILRREINITETLRELAESMADGVASPVQHLHLYCHRLTGSLVEDGELRLKFRERGCALKSLHIFTPQIIPFARLVLVGDGDKQQTPFQLCLYYDFESGPERFWVNPVFSKSSFHVLQSQDKCLEQGTAACTEYKHFDIAATGAVGIRMLVSAGGDAGIVHDIESISSVFWDELRPLWPFEFESFGADARRVRNLPRLLDSLFNVAGQELMGRQPQIPAIVAKLRFIQRCAQYAPNYADLVAEVETLLGRLELPRSFPTKLQSHSTDNYDWFFVPNQVPQALAMAMDATISNLIEANRRLESYEEMQKLRSLIQDTSGAIIKSVSASVGNAVTQGYLDEAAERAAGLSVTATEKMDELRKYENEVKDAADGFKEGIKKYQKDMEKKFKAELIKGLIQVGFSVGLAIYTGGAGAPLTVGAVNKVLKGAEAIKESSRLWMAIKALGTTALKIYPKIEAAFKNHEEFCSAAVDRGKRRGSAMDNLKRTASEITDKMFSSKVGSRIDYGGLLADWREMDMRIESAFSAIKGELDPKSEIQGLEPYRLALKKLAVRGETLVNALREAHEARTRYLLLEAERKTREAAVAEIQTLHQDVLAGKTQESIAFMAIKQRLSLELAQRRRVVFNKLHQGILALIYRTNDVKLQKEAFDGLSPAMSATELADHWAKFKASAITDYDPPQEQLLSVDTKQAFPLGWQDLLVNDLETPFQVPPTLSDITDNYQMRIRSLHAEFVGLKRLDGNTTGIEKLEYSIWLGPLMLDRASPYKGAPSSQATTVQYYMERRQLKKQGNDNDFVDDRNDFAKRALCCMGKLSFKRKVVDEGWDITTITDIRLHIKYETMVFDL